MDSETVKFKQIKFQYIIVTAANIINVCIGFGAGWMSSALSTLTSQETPFEGGPLTTNQKMWLLSVYHLGSLLGGCLFAVLVNYMGRITAMSLLAFPNFILWLTILLATSVEQLIIGRFIGGITAGGSLVSLQLFIAEIANKQIRGFLGMMGPLSIAVGLLASYICGAFIQYRFVPFCIIAFPVIFFILMTLTPETPLTLIRQKKMQKAEDSLLFYNNGNVRGDGYDVTDELNKLQILVTQMDEEKERHSYRLIFKKESLKNLFIGLTLVCISAFSGIIVMNSYAASLFRNSGAKFDANVSAIIVGVLQVCGIYVSSMLVDKVGRKLLFGISSFGASISLILFGTFSYLNSEGVNLSAADWVPVTSASVYIFVNCVGMRPMPFMYIAEVLPDNVRHVGVTICMMSMSLFGFIAVFTLPILEDLLKFHVVIWIYGGVCALGTVFSIFVMKETKGRNLNKLNVTYSTIS